MTDEEQDRIRQLVITSRRRQGLPDHITDTAFLSALAAALLTPDPDPLAEGRVAS